MTRRAALLLLAQIASATGISTAVGKEGDVALDNFRLRLNLDTVESIVLTYKGDKLVISAEAIWTALAQPEVGLHR